MLTMLYSFIRAMILVSIGKVDTVILLVGQAHGVDLHATVKSKDTMVEDCQDVLNEALDIMAATDE